MARALSEAERSSAIHSLIGTEPGEGRLIPKPIAAPDFFKIQPNPSHPAVARASDFRIGRVESGFDGHPPDVLLYVNPAGLAGDGPSTQALQVAEGMRKIANILNIPFYYAGASGGVSDISEEKFTGSLPEQITSFSESNGDTPAKYKTVEKTLTDTIYDLANKGHENIFIVSTGYTGFVPFGLKRAIETVKQETRKNIRAKLIMQDSSFPDEDNPSFDTTVDGYPYDRFYPPGYASNADVEVWMLNNSWIDFNIKWARHRAPNGIVGASSSIPFTPEYIHRWTEWREVKKESAREMLAEYVRSSDPAFAEELVKKDNIFIPFFASSGYFDASNIGKWLTRAQFDDMMIGSKKLVHAAREIARLTGKKVLLSGVPKFIEIANSLNLPDMAEITASEAKKAKVLLVRAPRFPQSKYGMYHRAADVVIHRTVQANSSAESVIAGVPQLIFTIPGEGYMDAPKMDQGAYLRGLRQYTSEVDMLKLASRLTDIATDPGEAASLVDAADTYFLQNHKNPGTNFFTMVAHLAGIPIPPFPNADTVYVTNQ
ncbi:MAG: hypothetical protein M1366_00040 [Patescibacteria group bacterium]|nr:hypothetical protein [Patescibacteria group bacterium]